jgi:hypothetical protein
VAHGERLAGAVQQQARGGLLQLVQQAVGHGRLGPSAAPGVGTDVPRSSRPAASPSTRKPE